MRLNERQRAFLQDAATNEAWITRRGGWHTVMLPDKNDWCAGSSVRGVDLGNLISASLLRHGKELEITPQGIRLGSLYTLYHAVNGLYSIAHGAGSDIREMVEHFEKLVWAKVQEAEK